MRTDHLFITDLDGTLLRSGARLSDYARKVLKRLLAAGLPFTIATARSIVSVREILGDLPINLPIICGNGAYMAYLHDTSHRFTHAIPTLRCHEMFEIIQSHELMPFLSAYTGTANRLFMPPNRNSGTQWYWEERSQAQDPRLIEQADLLSCLEHQVMSFNIIGLQSPIESLEASLRAQFGDNLELYTYEKVHTGEWYWLSAYDHKATKANAIQVLLDDLGLKPTQLTVFGDSLNDISMFRMAGTSIAVSNARPAIMELADEIIGHHENDSVVEYLRQEMFV